MKIIRIVFALIVLFASVLVLALGVLFVAVDPNQLKPTIAQQFVQKTGYQLVIDGNLTWSFYPRLAIHIAHMTISMPGEAQAFADLSNVKIATPLTQLFHGREKLTGKVHIAALRLLNIKAQNAYIGIDWQNGILTLQPLTAELYQGKLTGKAHGRDFAQEAHWDWDTVLEQVQVQALLQDVNRHPTQLSLSGSGQIHIEAMTQGKDRQQLLSHLNGNLQFSIAQGALQGIDLNYFVQTANALLSHQPVPTLTPTGKTLFEKLIGTGTFNNGMLQSNDLMIVTPAFTTTANGQLQLLDQTLDFRVQIKSQTAVNTSWEIPLTVTGNLQQPQVALDRFAIEKFLAQEKFDKLKAKVSHEIKEHVPGKAGEFLQNLLGH